MWLFAWWGLATVVFGLAVLFASRRVDRRTDSRTEVAVAA